MNRVVIVMIVLIFGLIVHISTAYEIKLNSSSYDILMFERWNDAPILGINYKDFFEVWRFEKNAYGGRTEMLIYPR